MREDEMIQSFYLSHMTPAEKCGIKVEGENKWKTLIQNATIKKHVNEDESL
jgi:hypothetical protein